MFSKKKLLATPKFDVVKAQEKSFIDILDRALRHVDAGEDAKAQKRIDEAKALWGKVKKVHGVEL